MLLIGSTLTLVMALWLMQPRCRSRLLACVVTAVALCWALLTLLHLVSDYFTGRGVDDAVVYHLQVGLDGAGFGEYRSITIMGVAILLLALACSVLLYRWLGAGRSEVSNARRLGWIGTLLLPIALALHPASQGLASVYAERLGWWETAPSAAAMKLIDPRIQDAPRSSPNLVVLYLESLERTYMDEARFPGLMPRLAALEAEAISFTDVRQVHGAGFTMAGLVATQCGVPITTVADGNSLDAIDRFLPGATCLGDLLAERGYRLTFMGGAPLRFAGKGNFQSSHGFEQVLGLNELRDQIDDPQRVSSWGIYDDDLFALLERQIADLSSSEQPFGVFALTLDTHHPDGHLSRACADVRYGDGSNPILNAVHCTDRMVAGLVDRLRSLPDAQRPLIVLASDHLAMRNSASAQLEAGSRRNLLMFVPPDAGQAQRIDRPASTLDVAPTVLASLGFTVEGVGFGRNLFGPAPTLLEQVPDQRAFLRSQQHLLRRLWQFPGLEHGMLVDESRRSARFGHRKIEIPAVLALRPDLDVQFVAVDGSWPSRLPGYLGKLALDQPFLYVDHCSVAADIGARIPEPIPRCGSLCVFGGRLDAAEVNGRRICGELFMSRDEVRELVQVRPTSDDDFLRQRLARFDTIMRSGASEAIEWQLGGAAQWDVRSAGSGAGYSFVQPAAARPDLQLGTEGLERGISVFELTASGARKVLHVDTCVLRDAVPEPGQPTLRKLLDETPERDWLLVAHDSAYCGNRQPLQDFFAGTALQKGAELEFRQPYVGLLRADGRIDEHAGLAERSLLVRLK